MSELQTIADLRRERDRCEIGFRIARAKAVEWNIKKLEGQLIGREVAQQAWAERVTKHQTPWPVLAKTLARRCVAKNPRQLSAILRDAIHEALNRLAEGLPAKA